MIPHCPKMQRKELLRISAVLLLFFGELSLSVAENIEVCKTEECYQISNAFMGSMNLSVDPCVDFYEYACGGWKSNQEIIPQYEIKWDRFIQFRYIVEDHLREELKTEISPEENLPTQQLKKWYQSCVDFKTRNEDGLKPILSLINKSGGWPMIMNTEQWSSNFKPWQEIDLFYGNFTGKYALFSAETRKWGKDAMLTLGHADVPLKDTLGGRRNYTKDHEDMIPYRSMIKKIAELFIKEVGTHVSPEQLDKDIADLIEFERQVYKAANKFDMSDAIEAYEEELEELDGLDEFIEWWNNRTVSIVSTPKAEIDWSRIFQVVFDIGDIQLNKSAAFQIYSISYLIDLVKLLESTDERTIVNYVHWNFVSQIVQYTSDAAKEIFFQIILKPKGFRKRRPHWMECLREIPMRDAAAYIYVKTHYTEITQEAVDKLVKNIKQGLADQIGNSNWLSDDAKEAAQNKLEEMGTVIGYPEWYKNETAFINYYKGLTVGDNYFENHLNFMRYEKEVELRKYLGYVDNDEDWAIDVLTINAVYASYENSLIIPAVDFQSPLFGKSVPSYINYAVVGSIIGHEMGHGFDIDGIEFGVEDSDSLMSEDMIEIYQERAECFVEMFDNYFRGMNNTSGSWLGNKTVLSIGENSTLIRKKLTLGKLTAGENIADWTGFGASLHAYEKMSLKELPDGEVKLPKFEEFTDERMFFLTFAQIWCGVSRPSVEKSKKNREDSHSPPSLRVIATLANTPAFAETFECPKNSAMNPENRCSIWMKKNR